MKRLVAISISLFSLVYTVPAQIPAGYEVATWQGFKQCAITYTFDDYTPNQIPVALPIFDQYNFKATFYPIISWNPDWTKLTAATANGHEVGSHTVTHINLGNETNAQTVQKEIQDAQTTINERIPGKQCLTIAYPYCSCNENVKSIVKQSYIGARICSGIIEHTTPSDFFALSSIACGSMGLNSSQALNHKVNEAIKTNGWCIFLLHGINNDGGYSPMQDSVLNAHLNYVKMNVNNYWVDTFSQVIKYIKERDTVKIIEKSVSLSEICFTVTDTLSDNCTFNIPLTIKRLLPPKWKKAVVSKSGLVIQSEIKKENGKQFICFNAIPDSNNITIRHQK